MRISFYPSTLIVFVFILFLYSIQSLCISALNVSEPFHVKCLANAQVFKNDWHWNSLHSFMLSVHSVFIIPFSLYVSQHWTYLNHSMLNVLLTHRYSNRIDIETPSTLLCYLFIQFFVPFLYLSTGSIWTWSCQRSC
jgi:hypothetical protein